MSDQYQHCGQVMAHGEYCGSPALKDSNLCYWHHKARTRRRNRDKIAGPISNPGIFLPTLEDAASVQVAIQEISHAIVDRRIDDKRASLLLYAMQLASNNVRHLDPVSVGGTLDSLDDRIDEVGEDDESVEEDDDEEDSDNADEDESENDAEESADEEAGPEQEGDNKLPKDDGDESAPQVEPEAAAPDPDPPKKKASLDYEAFVDLAERINERWKRRNGG